MSTPKSLLDTTYVNLHRIIPFSNVEGTGNRCSIFLQGCNINCLYCHNPETIKVNDDDAGKVSLSYLLEQVKESMPFIRGITCSGGEPTMHFPQLTIFFKAVKELGLTCYLDSNGFFNFEQIKDLIDVTDKFLFDIKGIGSGLERLCFDYKNENGKVHDEKVEDSPIMSRNIENLKRLLPMGKIEEVRLVHIKNFYDPYKTLDQIIDVLVDYPEVTLKLIRVHAKGARDVKGVALNMPTVNEHEALANHARSRGIKKVIVIQ